MFPHLTNQCKFFLWDLCQNSGRSHSLGRQANWGAETWNVGLLRHHRCAVWTWGWARSNPCIPLADGVETRTPPLPHFPHLSNCGMWQNPNHRAFGAGSFVNIPCDSTKRDLTNPRTPICLHHSVQWKRAHFVLGGLCSRRMLEVNEAGPRGGCISIALQHSPGLQLSLTSTWGLRNCRKLIRA